MILAVAAVSFLVVTLDDVQRGAYMPQLEARFGAATVYPNAVVETPLCGPSRGVFLTGQRAQNSGIVANEAADWGTGFVPQALRAAGYRTMIVGKMPNGFTGTPGDLGFEEHAILEELGGDRYWNATLIVNGRRVETTGYTSDNLYRRGRNCVEGAKPFFCWIAALGAHAPAEPAPRYVGGCSSIAFNPGPAFNEANMSDKPPFMRDFEPLVLAKVEKNWRAQCETLLADDEGIESMLDLVGPDVCVIVTADNGRLHGQHRITGKSFLYEESIGVPLYTWGCGTAPGVDDRLVSNLDVPAHILSLAAVTPLRPLDGRRFDASPRNRAPIRGGTDVDATGWRYADDRVEWTFADGFREGYDLVDDPAQERNQAAAQRR